MKCANCSNDSMYEYRVTEKVSTFFCGKHLPKFLEPRKQAGLLATTEKFVEAKTEVLATLAPELTVIEEPKQEAEDKPKPKKKASKKKAE